MVSASANSKPLVMVTQSLISYLGDVPLQVDGVVGKRTREAYLTLKPKDRAFVDKALAGLTGNKDVVKSLGLVDLSRPRDMPNKEMVSLIKRYCREMDFPVETALPIFYIESGLNPNTTSHTGAKGLGQLTRIAVKDVLPKASDSEINQTMERLYDPHVNIPLSIQSMRNSLKYLNAGGGFNYSVFDTAEVYMAYNIGPSAAVKVLKGDYRDPSVVKMVGYQGSLGPPERYEQNVRSRLNRAYKNLGINAMV